MTVNCVTSQQTCSSFSFVSVVAVGGAERADGATSSQVFLYPAAVNLRVGVERLDMMGEVTVYVIRNGDLVPNWSAVERKLQPIVMTSLEVVIRAQGIW